MTDDLELLKKRLTELANKSYNSGIFVFTDFLGLAEQSVFSEIKREISHVKYTEFGGTPGTERVMIRFGDPDELGYELPYPISAVKVAPVSPKFADRLTHRDFLGAILNLGIERHTVGDIAIVDNVGYVFAKEDIAQYICRELIRIKRTDVTCSITEDLPAGQLYRTEPRTVQISSERLDAVIAKAFSLSRDDAQSLFKKRLVFISGKCSENTSYTPKIGDVISVRGQGRFIYKGYSSTSKKGKLNVILDLYV